MPYSYDSLIRARAALLSQAATDPVFAEQFKAACAKDAGFFINNCLWINEPRAEAGLRDVPFILREFQQEYIKELQASLEGDYSLLTDKTREMGVTWMFIAVLLWAWLFQRRFSCLLGSITEDKIDSRNNSNTLFWKFDYLLNSLKLSTPFLYPTGYNEKQHRTHMKAFNPDMDSMFLGEPMGPNWGRSGRVKVAVGDEFAEAATPASTYASSSRTANCRWFVFTPKGMNFAGQLANPSRGKPRTIKRVMLHWMVDESKNHYIIRDGQTGKIIHRGNGNPDYEAINSKNPHAMKAVYPWYEQAKADLNYDPLLVAQELDVNYNESAEGQMYPQIEKARFGRFAYDPYLPLYCSMDYGLADLTALVWFQYDRQEARFKIISAFQARGKTIKWYIPFMTGGDLGLGQAEGGYSPSEEAIIKRHGAFMGRYSEFYGDPAGKQKNQVTATSVIQILGQHKIYVKTNDKANEYHTRKQSMAEMLLFSDFDEENCQDLIQAIRDSRQRENGTPIHGPESHYRSAFEYGAVNQPHGMFGAQSKNALTQIQTPGIYVPEKVRRENPFAQVQYERQLLEQAEKRILEAQRASRTNGESGFTRQRGGWGR